MRSILILTLTLLLFSQCTKKASEVMTSSASNVTKNTESFRSKAPGAAPARPIDLGKYNAFDLANGLKVIVVENHKLPRVSYQISLSNDALVEGEQAGYVQFAGDLLTKGTKNRTKAKLDEEIDFIGATLNSTSGGMFATSLKKHSGKLLELMSDVLYNPVFPKAEFDKMKSQTISALTAAKADPNAIASNVLNIINYGKNHPYGEVQTEKTTNAITLESCKAYYDTYFRPNNAYLIIVGDIDPAAAKLQAEKYFASWKKAEIPQKSYVVPTAPKQAAVAFANKDGAVQSVINVTYPVDLKIGSADELAVNVMNNILGGGIFSGRLMQNLREKKAYTYGARSSMSSDKLVGNFKAFASVRNAVTDSSVQEFLYEMNRIRTEAVTANDLQLAKNSMAGSFARSLESPQTMANFALNTFKYNLPKDYYNTYLSRLEKISIADVQRVAQKYITPQNANILVVGNKDEVAAKLLRFDGDGKIDYYDAYGEVLNYDNIAIPAGVTGLTIIEDYIDAIGGKEKLMAIKSKITNATLSLGGQNAFVTTKQKSPDKFLFSMGMQGMVMSEQKYNGQKASTMQMGQAKVSLPGEPEFEEIKDQLPLFDQLEYFKPGYKLEVKGSEEVEGSRCYKVAVTNPFGKLRMQYYDIKTSILKRESQNEGEGENAKTITSDFKDYKDVSGIMMPHEVVITGQAPFPLAMKITSYEFNTTIEDSVFDIK